MLFTEGKYTKLKIRSIDQKTMFFLKMKNETNVKTSIFPKNGINKRKTKIFVSSGNKINRKTIVNVCVFAHTLRQGPFTSMTNIHIRCTAVVQPTFTSNILDSIGLLFSCTIISSTANASFGVTGL